MTRSIAAIVCAAALFAASSISATPDNLANVIPTNLNELINQSNGGVATLLNDPGFLASASAALKSLDGFMSSNPGLVSSIMQVMSTPLVVAGDGEEGSNSKSSSEKESGASSIKPFTGAVAAVGLTALAALF
ncbi:hypothetical protein J3B02_005633 [Coemansia erecta]|uniref:Uncharacterized protein n=1 Tax=Coemansia asiatica TaxID=1052880 RepID=A0A9W7XH77_9FUNG|nr:hypothetical protein LPJ64_005681 [Coemansia asiatica]KAJ2842262.1 hypothetical protein J3B02_005633 [Coemansia erecta]KAJ2870809.1 hypothetical protein FB639_004566 [Coemansia asiatica]